MKRLLLIVLPLLLIVGCSSPEPINYEEMLNYRDGMYYTKDTNKPYSGQVFSLHDDGKKKGEGSLKDGKMISKTEWEWYQNEQKKSEIHYKDGKKDGLQTEWYENGQKRWEGTIKDGNKDGLSTQWWLNGQKMVERTWKDGIEDGLVTEWYENGEKEREGTYKDGKDEGLWTFWFENGQKESERTFKDGNLISDKYWNEDGSVKEDDYPSNEHPSNEHPSDNE